MTETAGLWFHQGMESAEYTPKLIRDLLQTQGSVLLDGAWGSLIAEHHPELASHPALACMQDAELVSRMGMDYVTAGAMGLTTNTFRASSWLLNQHGLDAVTVNRRAFELAASASPSCILGSVGPIRLEARRAGVRESEDDCWLSEQFETQARALIEAGCRTLWLETFGELREALAAIQGCHEAGAEEVCCSYYAGPEGKLPADGTSLVKAFRYAEEDGASIVGINCIPGLEEALRLLTGLGHGRLGIPLAVRPNAGQPVQVDGRWVYPLPPENFGTVARRLRDAGVRIFGGCCGTTPEHIRAMRDALRQNGNTWEETEI